MSNTDRKRRERIRRKQEARSSASTPASEISLSSRSGDVATDMHVRAAPGRTARQRRRKLQKEARNATPVVNVDQTEPSNWMQHALAERLNLKPGNLREKRASRQRERDRRERLDRPEARVRPIGVVHVSWRWLSGSLSLFLVVILYAMLGSNAFVIDTISVGGERYISPELIFQSSDVAGKNLFTLDAESIEAQLEENPGIADAQVFVSWPPDAVSIIISERDPALIWDQGSFRVWVDINGIVMFRREERDDLLRIVHRDNETEPLGIGSVIDREIVAGALQLHARLPEIDVFLYDPAKGLGFLDETQERRWTAWFGVGTDMERRLNVYNQIVASYYPAWQISEIDVSDADYPYLTRRQ